MPGGLSTSRMPSSAVRLLRFILRAHALQQAIELVRLLERVVVLEAELGRVAHAEKPSHLSLHEARGALEALLRTRPRRGVAESRIADLRLAEILRHRDASQRHGAD